MKTNTKQPGDGFARFYHFAEQTLREARAPGWYDLLYRLLMSRSNYDTGLYDGSIPAIQTELKRRRIKKSDNTIRHALRRFRQLGLLDRDGEVNQHTRRIKAVLRRGLTHTLEQLRTNVAVLIGKMRGGTVQREIHRPIDRSACQRYQKSGSDSFKPNPNTRNSQKTGAVNVHDLLKASWERMGLQSHIKKTA